MDSEAAREDLRQINTTISDELTSKSEILETVSNDRSRIRDHTLGLNKKVRRLQRKTLRAPRQRSHAVEVATMKTAGEFKARSNPWRMKRPDGRIENWVRDLSCRLMVTRHIPASQIPGAISDVLRAIEANTSGHDGTDNDGSNVHADSGNKETFSDRSVRRFPIERHILGKIQAAREFKATPG